MRSGREADHSPPTNTEVKDTWVYIHSAICFHGVVLKCLSTEIILPLPITIIIIIIIVIIVIAVVLNCHESRSSDHDIHV
jgi:hypothetical protein